MFRLETWDGSDIDTSTSKLCLEFEQPTFNLFVELEQFPFLTSL